MAENAHFFSEENNECFPNFELFNENEFLETSNDLDDSEISLFIEENRNENTTRKTKTDLNVWKRWCESVKETRAIEEIPAEELNSLLCHFFVKVRKLNGEDFEPGTLTSFQRSFDRHLRQVGKCYSILQDKTFEKSREALESKRKQLRQSGKGGRPK